MGLDILPSAFVSLDANKPWLCYWLLHSLDLLGSPISSRLAEKYRNQSRWQLTLFSAIYTLSLCQNPTGGYGGGAGQAAHLATTYAAVAALAIVGTEEAYKSINVEGLLAYLMRMKQPNGSFSVHDGGEADSRGCYCALASAALTGLLDKVSPGCETFIASCQTYEGGFGAVPFGEAHAGYSYCAFAALVLIGKSDAISLEALAGFACNSQCSTTGGFRGRTNKLVDGCYSFWAGALFPLLRQAGYGDVKFDAEALQKFLLICCQDVERGGLKDKPEKYPPPGVTDAYCAV